MPPRRGIALVAFALLAGLQGAVVGRDDPPEPDGAPLAMTKAVACKSITGFDHFEPLPEAVVSKDDKLLVYFESTGHTIQRIPSGYRAHLIEDFRIRRHGAKPVLQSKDKVVDYKVTSKEPPHLLYISTTIALKGLRPGDYDLDIILRDALSKREPATQTLRFKIKEPPPIPDESPRADDDRPASPRGQGRRRETSSGPERNPASLQRP